MMCMCVRGVLTVSLLSQNLLAYCLCTTQPTDRTFTSITSPCLPPQWAQNNLSLSSHYSPISSNSVTLLYEGAGAELKQDRMRKTRCDREEGFTKDRKHRDMSKRTGGRDGGRKKRGEKNGWSDEERNKEREKMFFLWLWYPLLDTKWFVVIMIWFNKQWWLAVSSLTDEVMKVF